MVVTKFKKFKIKALYKKFLGLFSDHLYIHFFINIRVICMLNSLIIYYKTNNNKNLYFKLFIIIKNIK
jgi:hypothetical protein